MRMRQLRSCAGLLTLALFTLSSPAWAQSDFRWEGALGAGKSLEIKGINGSVTASLASGDRALVEAAKHAKRANPDEVKIEVVEHADGVTICAVYPTPKGKKPNRCGPGQDGRMQVKDNDTKVDFTVRVPAGVRFVGATVNGSIEATGLEGDVRAQAVNGSIKIQTTGAAIANTVNGSIRAAMGRMPGKAAEFKTVNGGITLTLPQDAAVDLDASTVNGNFASDFPVTLEGSSDRVRWGPKKIQGKIGGGGASLELKTVNGSIHVTRGG